MLLLLDGFVSFPMNTSFANRLAVSARNRTNLESVGTLRRSLVVAVAACAWLPVGAAAAEPHDRVDEYQVKAAFLFNFAKFVAWPEAPGQPLVIGIIGDDAFGAVIDAAVRGKSVNNRPLEVRRLGYADDTSGCQIVYVSGSERRHRQDVLRRVGNGVLTVGDVPQFVRDGGVIGFLLDGNRVRFQINAGAAEQRGLKIHSQLMSLAAK
jgi:hypothetical protein